MSQSIHQKLQQKTYQSEKEFVDDLDDREMQYLDKILAREISYAENVQDDQRVQQLREVYEIIF